MSHMIIIILDDFYSHSDTCIQAFRVTLENPWPPSQLNRRYLQIYMSWLCRWVLFSKCRQDKCCWRSHILTQWTARTIVIPETSAVKTRGLSSKLLERPRPRLHSSSSRASFAFEIAQCDFRLLLTRIGYIHNIHTFAKAHHAKYPLA